MTTVERRLERLQHRADAAVFDPVLWRAVCDDLADTIGGVGACFFPTAPERQNPLIVESPRLAGLTEEFFRDGWASRNTRMAAAELAPSRGIVTDYDIADEDAMRRDPFYTELLARHGLGIFIGFHLRAGDEPYTLSIERSLASGAPTRDDLDLSRHAAGIVARSVRASVALASAGFDSWKQMAAESSRAVFVVDALGRVVDLSEAGETLVGRVFDLSERRLRLIDPRADTGFSRLLLAAYSPNGPAVLPRPVFIHAEGIGSMMIEAVRLPASMRHFHSVGAALVVVRQVDDDRSSLGSILQRHAGLTAAEIRVALALFEGHSVAEYAARSGLAVGTVRQQLKAVYRKTGAGRQAELAALMRRLAEGSSS